MMMSKANACRVKISTWQPRRDEDEGVKWRGDEEAVAVWCVTGGWPKAINRARRVPVCLPCYLYAATNSASTPWHLVGNMLTPFTKLFGNTKREGSGDDG